MFVGVRLVLGTSCKDNMWTASFGATGDGEESILKIGTISETGQTT